MNPYDLPIVYWSILARDKAATLPLYLQCLTDQYYPRERVLLDIFTNDSTDNTAQLLNDWWQHNRQYYHPRSQLVWQNIRADVPVKPHEWPESRLALLARLRDEMLRSFLQSPADYFLSCDADNYLAPWALDRMVQELQQPGVHVVAPRLRCVGAGSGSAARYANARYSNYHHCVTDEGYFIDCRHYNNVLRCQRQARHLVAVVHCTYALSRSAASVGQYSEGRAERLEYVRFAESLRCSHVEQWLLSPDGGCLTLDESADSILAARAFLDRIQTTKREE